jgi:hypothetical protein
MSWHRIQKISYFIIILKIALKDVDYYALGQKEQNSGGTGTSAAAKMLCSPPAKSNDWILECSLGNPMLAGSKVGPVIKLCDDSHRICISLSLTLYDTSNIGPDLRDALYMRY